MAYDSGLFAFCRILKNPILDWFLECDPELLITIAANDNPSHWRTLDAMSELLLREKNKGYITPFNIVSALKSGGKEAVIKKLIISLAPAATGAQASTASEK
jgi:hypothetical protein